MLIFFASQLKMSVHKCIFRIHIIFYHMRSFNKTTATLVRPHPFSTLWTTPKKKCGCAISFRLQTGLFKMLYTLLLLKKLASAPIRGDIFEKSEDTFIWWWYLKSTKSKQWFDDNAKIQRLKYFTMLYFCLISILLHVYTCFSKVYFRTVEYFSTF